MPHVDFAPFYIGFFAFGSSGRFGMDLDVGEVNRPRPEVHSALRCRITYS